MILTGKETEFTKKVPLFIAILFCLLTLLIIWFWHTVERNFKQLNDIWIEHTEESNQQALMTAKIIKHFGYGGFIHHFKNLVLRQHQEYSTAADKDLKLTLAAINHYLTYDLTAEQKASLNAFKDTVLEYERKFRLLHGQRELYDNPSKIDKIVKVDDTKAILALENIFHLMLTKNEDARVRSNDKLNESLYLYRAGIMILLIFALLSMGVCFIAYNQTKKYWAERDAKERSMLKSEELERFVYTLSHDLKAPLFTINGFATTLQDDLKQSLTDDTRFMLDRILENASRMDQFIKELLIFSRAFSARLEPSTIYLADCLKKVESILAAELADSEATLDYPQDQLAIKANETMLLQCLQNLISNAIKYRSPERPPVITISHSQRKKFKAIQSPLNWGKGASLHYYSPCNLEHQHHDNIPLQTIASPLSGILTQIWHHFLCNKYCLT